MSNRLVMCCIVFIMLIFCVISQSYASPGVYASMQLTQNLDLAYEDSHSLRIHVPSGPGYINFALPSEPKLVSVAASLGLADSFVELGSEIGYGYHNFDSVDGINTKSVTMDTLSLMLAGGCYFLPLAELGVYLKFGAGLTFVLDGRFVYIDPSAVPMPKNKAYRFDGGSAWSGNLSAGALFGLSKHVQFLLGISDIYVSKIRADFANVDIYMEADLSRVALSIGFRVV